jgi:ferredoxin/flavodoxin---NADP+ reductase
MPFAITSACCNDASCVSVCPVNCIHPTPDEPDFGTTDTLFVDPEACIDCGACADACPVEAIFPVDVLRGADTVFAERNAQYYAAQPRDHSWTAPDFPRSLPAEVGPLRIAIVGTGPAASYAAQALLSSTDAELTILDRLPVPGGLLRSGVAPDHPSTKRIGDGFAEIYRSPRVRLALNVDVGRDITAEELSAAHSAVLYAVGAATDRPLDVPGERLPNSHSATDLVGWYNAHPDLADLSVDLSGERAVVVGTGNVALDVARILLSDPDELAGTDISDRALRALRTSRVREVVLLGRRGAEHVAFSAGEFLGLRAGPGPRIVVDDTPGVRAALAAASPGSPTALLAEAHLETIEWSLPAPEPRIVFRFDAPVIAVQGSDRVEAVEVGGIGVGGIGARISAGLVVRAIGYRGKPVPGLPFDATTATVPHEQGRVVDPRTGGPVPGTYVTGWIKRGSSGGIGANRRCADETVGSLLDDAVAARLPTPSVSAQAFHRLLRQRCPDLVDSRAAAAIDRAERAAGGRSGRPRVKFPTVEDMLAAGRRRPGRLAGRLHGRLGGRLGLLRPGLARRRVRSESPGVSRPSA